MLRKILLSGELGKMFGREHKFSISTPAEAIRALCANHKGFARHMIESEARGLAYRVTVDKEPLGEVSNVHNPFSRTVRIVPVIMGAKSGFMGIVLGAALIGAAFLTGGASLAAGGVVFSGLAGQVAFGLGVSMLMGGVSQLLSPTPKAAKPTELPENQPSYAFNGPVNTSSAGQCVPYAFGRLIVGSAVGSAGISADDFTAAGVA